jgi:hypothetical protein
MPTGPAIEIRYGPRSTEWERELGERRGWVFVRVTWSEDDSLDLIIRAAVTRKGRVICTGLILGGHHRSESAPELPAEITARALRRVPLPGILERLSMDPGVLQHWHEMEILGTDVRPTVRPGPKDHAPEHYAEVIAAYRQAVREAPSSPVKRLAEIWQTPEGKPTPEPTIRRWLKEARAKYGLEPTPRGRPSTPRTGGEDEQAR